MKRFRVLIVVCVIIVALAATFAMRRKKSNFLANLAPYITSDKNYYMDPSTMYTGVSPSSLPPGALQPFAMRTIEVKNIQPEKLDALIHEDLQPKDGWKFNPSPFGHSKPAYPAFLMISAYRGASAVTPGNADETLFLMPSSFGPSPTISDPSTPKVTSYRIMSMHRMSRLEVWWLKITHVGRNPYSSPEEMFTP